MTRKIITGVVAAVLLVTMAVLAAEKVKEKVLAEKPKAGERGEKMGQPERLLDELAEAYKANDRQKMGEIIAKMQERREKTEKFVKLNRWHKGEHRRMMGQMGHGWGRGQQMAGPGWNRDCPMRGQGPNQGCSMPMAGGLRQMPCQQRGMGMGNWMPQQCCPMQMQGWDRDGLQQCPATQQGMENMGPPMRERFRSERQNIPPAEWGW
jgi:hypothetical protein